MVHITDISAAFMFLSGTIGLGLTALAALAYRRTGQVFMGFVAAAFLVFTVKSVLVGFSLLKDLIDHAVLELVDASGDLIAILLFAIPLFLPANRTKDDA